MKKFILILSLAAAQAVASPCSERLVPYSTPIARPDAALAMSAGAGRLAYLGARHSTDPAAPQFADIERQWNDLRPRIAFYEGPNRPVPDDRDEAIRQTGESGFVRWLAARDGVPLARLEPDPQANTADTGGLFTQAVNARSSHLHCAAHWPTTR